MLGGCCHGVSLNVLRGAHGARVISYGGPELFRSPWWTQRQPLLLGRAAAKAKRSSSVHGMLGPKGNVSHPAQTKPAG